MPKTDPTRVSREKMLALRTRSGLGQREFADALFSRLATVQSWEYTNRKPYRLFYEYGQLLFNDDALVAFVSEQIEKRPELRGRLQHLVRKGTPKG